MHQKNWICSFNWNEWKISTKSKNWTTVWMKLCTHTHTRTLFEWNVKFIIECKNYPKSSLSIANTIAVENSFVVRKTQLIFQQKVSLYFSNDNQNGKLLSLVPLWQGLDHPCEGRSQTKNRRINWNICTWQNNNIFIYLKEMLFDRVIAQISIYATTKWLNK